MALVLNDRVLETCTSPGTGAVSLLGAATGYQTFSVGVGNTNTCYYTIADQSGPNWEVGIGTYATTGNTLTRTTVLSSSNAGSLTNFSSGTQNVFVAYPAEKAVYLDASSNYVPSTPTFTSITDSGLTSGRVTYAGTGGLLQDSANLTFNGTTLTTANDAAISGLTVGKGGGAVASNTALGLGNLQRNTTGSQNTSGGWNALTYNTTGVGNTVFGYYAGVFNTTGGNQTAFGNGALASATTAVATFGSITAGSGYTNGTYTAVAMSAVSGATFVTYPTVTVVVSGGVVTTVTLVTVGGGASSTAATVLTVAAALLGGTGSGFSIPVATFATASSNTAVGSNALAQNTTGTSNTAVGYNALSAATTASFNTAVGYNTLSQNTTGGSNTAFGYQALTGVTTASQLTAVGQSALAANTTGNTNNAFGFLALQQNTTGNSNNAFGNQTLNLNTTGSNNIAIGYLALIANTIGGAQVAIGNQALVATTTNVATLGAITGGSGYTNGTYTGVVMTLSSGSTAGTYPTATIVVSGGAVTTVTITSAGSAFKDTTTVLTAPAASIGGTGSGFTVPVATLATGQNNTAIGTSAGVALTTGSNNLILGNTAAASTTTVSNEITLGNSSITAFRIPGLSITAAPSALTVGSQFAVTNTASAVNYLQATGSVASSAPILSAQGSDTNIGITLTPKGTGAVTTAASVGIGTTTPNGQFEIVNSGNAVAVARSSGATNGSYFLAAASDYFSGPSYQATQLIQYNASATGTALGLNNANLGVLSFQNASNAAIFTNSGNILRIGTASTTAISIASNQVISLGAAPGSESLRVTPVASAVNYIQTLGAVTTGAPILSAQGSDTDIGLLLTGKGAGAVYIGANTIATASIMVLPVASSVNYWQVQGASTLNNNVIYATGADTNVYANYWTKGGGAHDFKTNNGNAIQVRIASTASTVNYLQLTGAATGGSPVLSVQGSDTDIGITLTPKGAGAVTTAASVGIGTTTPNTNLEVVGSPANFIARGSTTTSGAQVGAAAHDYFSGPSYKGTSLVQYSATASGTTCGLSNASLGYLVFNNTAANALIYSNGGTGIIFGTLSVDRGRVSSSGVWSFGAAAGSESLRATPVASAVNYVNVIGAITTASPAIQAAGSDTNIDLVLTPKGTGVLSFGTYTAGVVAQAGYITIKDAGGTTRRLLVG